MRPSAKSQDRQLSNGGVLDLVVVSLVVLYRNRNGDFLEFGWSPRSFALRFELLSLYTLKNVFKRVSSSWPP